MVTSREIIFVCSAVNLHHYLVHYEARKNEESTWDKNWDTASQKLKNFIFALFGGGLFYNFINNFTEDLCMKMMWGQLDFFLVISIANSAFSDKRNSNSKKLCPSQFLWPWSVDKVLRFSTWYGFWHLINFEKNFSVAWFLPNQYMEITSLNLSDCK